MLTILSEELGISGRILYYFFLSQQLIACVVFALALTRIERFSLTWTNLKAQWGADRLSMVGICLFWYGVAGVAFGSGFDLLDGNRPDLSMKYWVRLRTEGGANLIFGAALFHWKSIFWPTIKRVWRDATDTA